jgi:alpha-mannosidase
MRSTLVIMALLVLVLGASAGAQNTVWQIGQFDNDYREFAIHGNYDAYSASFPKDVTFHAGTDDPSKSWPFIQPGPTDAWAGQKAHPFTIAFSLPEQPKGVYTLTLDLVNTHYSAPPIYEININGHKGTFPLPAGGGDDSLTDATKGKEHVVKIPLPASLLKAGDNSLVLTSASGSWLMFDALSLVNDPSATVAGPGVNKVTLTPTIRFVQSGAKLMQVLKLSVECTPGTPSCTARVKIGDFNTQASFEPDLVGTAATEMLVDEVTAPTTAEVVAEAGGQSKSFTCAMTPQKHWKIYVQDSTHVDIGYTDYQEKIAKRHDDNMAVALDLCKQYPTFKWNTEAAWVEDNFLSLMPQDKKAEFIRLAKEGRIGCQAIYGNMLTGICSHESLIRDLYYSHNTAKKYGIPWDIAMSSDVPTQVWTLPTILANAGIKYYSTGLNLDRGYSFNTMFSKSPFYWQGPDGSKVLAWFSAGYAQAARLGLYTDVRQAEGRIEGFLKGFDRADYPYDAVLAFGGFGDNQPMSPSLASVVQEYSDKYAYPKVILCRGPEFFEYIEANFKDKIPTISGDAGVYWEDGAGSSADETRLVREAKEKLAAAEKVFSMAGGKYPKAEFDLAWKNAMLYDEHTWGAYCSISQPEGDQTVHQWKVKSGFAYDADKQAGDLVSRAMKQLAGTVKAPKGSVVVFNPLSWPISDCAMALTKDGHAPVYVENVPPLGYKVVTMPKKPFMVKSVTLRSGNPVLENRFYRIEFDRSTGAVRSLYDKDLKRELVDQKGPYGLNQYVYTIGRRNGPTVADMKDVTREGIATPVKFEAMRYGPAQVMSITSRAKNASQVSTIVGLDDKTKGVGFGTRLNKQETTEKEAGYFAFPFALDKPEWYVELPDGVVKPKSQMLPGADMQWFCAQDFVAADDGKGAIVWTATHSPLITIGDINRETFKSPMPLDNGHLYAYAFNNYWHTNYKASQGGMLVFQFALTSMPKYDPVAAARFGQSARNPLLAQAVGRNAKGRSTASLGSVDASNVVVQAVKQAESGKGTIYRLREVAGKKTLVTLSLPAARFKEAWSCTLVEDPQSKLAITGGKVKVAVSGNGLATVLVR